MSAPTMAESIAFIQRIRDAHARHAASLTAIPAAQREWEQDTRYFDDALTAMRNQQASRAEPVRFEYRLRHQDGTWYSWDTPSYDNTREERDREVRLAREVGIEAEARDLYEVRAASLTAPISVGGQ